MNRNKSLFRALSRTRRSGAGFTLIELLLVLVILAALAAIVVPKIAGRGEEAKVKSAIAQISMFKTALEMFQLDCGRLPTTEEGLQALVSQPANVQGWNQNGYIDGSAPPPDPWGHAYQYRFPGQHNPKSYDLYSFGPTGQDGSADNIGNWSTQQPG